VLTARSNRRAGQREWPVPPTGTPVAGEALRVGALTEAVTLDGVAAATGFADWRYLRGEKRRPAAGHGLLNVVGLVFNATSLGLRLGGRRRAGRVSSALREFAAVLFGGTTSATARSKSAERARSAPGRRRWRRVKPLTPVATGLQVAPFARALLLAASKSFATGRALAARSSSQASARRLHAARSTVQRVRA
jgi:hypothetical protein